eukprot:scaffold71564_cov73-Phaeocystis_antarctica.AAC.2
MPPPVPPPRLCEDNSTIKWYGAALNRSAEATGPTVPVGGPASPHSLLWLQTMNPANVFESISTLISAVYVMQSHGFSGRRFELRWHYAQQHLFLRLRGHAAVLAQRNARPRPRTTRVGRLADNTTTRHQTPPAPAPKPPQTDAPNQPDLDPIVSISEEEDSMRRNQSSHGSNLFVCRSS